MSRRNSASRRRAYGRRLHEMQERRPRRQAAAEWMDEMADGSNTDAPQMDHLAHDDWRSPLVSDGGPRR